MHGWKVRSQSQASAKSVMDALIMAMVEAELLTPAQQLEQIRVLDEDGQVRSAYPSRVDLPDLCLNWAKA